MQGLRGEETMERNKFKQLFADGSLLMVAAIWGATFVTVKNALVDITPFYFNTFRFSLATLLLMCISFKRINKINKSLLRAGILIGFLLYAGYSFQTIGLMYTSASNAGFITGLSVIFVPIFVTIFTKKAPSLGVIIGSILATGGLALLTLDKSLQINPGDFLVLICAISFALHVIAVGKFTHMHDTLLLVTVQVATVSLFSGISAVITEPRPSFFTSQVWWALFITAFLATALAFILQNWMQRFTTPTRTAIILSTEPAFTALFAYLLLGEVMSNQDWWGSLLVLLGMLSAELPWEKYLPQKVLSHF